jgi:hypothetical protein
MGVHPITDLLPQSGEPLLLCVSVDVGSDHKRNDVEERNPCLFRQELLRKGKGYGRRNPGDLHNWHKASSYCSSDLVPRTCTGNDSHRGKVYRVLDWRDLGESDAQ